jgi:hypothetical protein
MVWNHAQGVYGSMVIYTTDPEEVEVTEVMKAKEQKRERKKEEKREERAETKEKECGTTPKH